MIATNESSPSAAGWEIVANSGMFQCPTGSVPKPGMHCDSVEGSKSFGPVY